MSEVNNTDIRSSSVFNKYESPSEDLRFLTVYFSCMLLAALWSAHLAKGFPLPQGHAPAGVEGINWIRVLPASALLVVSATILKETDWLDFGYTFLRLRSFFVFSIYMIVTLLIIRGYSNQFVLFAALNGGYFALVFEIYSHPLLPKNAGQERLKAHQTNWWHFTQIFLTLSISLLVGISLSFFLGKFRAIMTILGIIVIPSLGMLSVLLYVGWKNRLIELEA